MRGILIDPFEKTITEVEVSKGIDAIYAAIKAEIFTIVMLNPKDTLFIDDEGLFVPKQEQEYWNWHGANQPYAGRGLILATDEWGESIGTTMDSEKVRIMVDFLDKEDIDPEAYLEHEVYAYEGGKWIKL